MKKVRTVVYLFLLLPLHCWAADSDRDQPINIEADQLEIREQENISIYQGNVQLVQGSLRINSDRLVIHFNEDNELTMMEMTGNLAKFQQLDNAQQLIRGEAEQIDYSDLDSLLILRRRASLDQDGKVINSDLIRYDTATNSLEAGGAQSDVRTTVVIPPRKTATPAKQESTPESGQGEAPAGND
jgi:lipopolysaccharide export system protein LptA